MMMGLLWLIFCPDTSSGYTAYAGTALQIARQPLAEDGDWRLKTVKDPEIPVNIYDLGLIYDITVNQNGDVAINMSLRHQAVLLPGKCLPRWLKLLPYWGGAGRGDSVWEPAWTRAHE